jgi:hypothetical protein
MVEPCNPEDKIVHKYSARILEVCGPLMDTADVTVKEQVISTIASVCIAAPDAFAPFYATFLGGLKRLVAGEGGQGGRESAGLRGRAMEALSFIGLAVVSVTPLQHRGNTAVTLLEHHCNTTVTRL